MTDFWAGKRVIVTGGHGFLGSHLVPMLQAAGANVFYPKHRDYDLTNVVILNRMFLALRRPDVLFHLAAVVGGIGANANHPCDFYAQNTLMNTLIVEAARQHNVGKFIGVGTVCAYPKHTPSPFVEANLWEGYPEETNAPYGVAKRGLLVHLQAARKQYDFNGIYLIPTNLYGPGDNFDPATSHVIPALIRKIDEAQQAGAPSITVWGTGSAGRDFLYVEDCARALMLAAEFYNSGEPVNLGSGEEICIHGLVEILKGIMDYHGAVEYDAGKPDGQPRRVLNTTRAMDSFGWRAETELIEGLARTVEAWRNTSTNS